GPGSRQQARHDRRGLCDEDAGRHRQERRSVALHSVISRSRRTTQSRRVRRVSNRKRLCVLCGSALIVVISIACGQKGPPLPPLVLTPAPPEVTADRRGSTIEIEFTVPSATADG